MLLENYINIFYHNLKKRYDDDISSVAEDSEPIEDGNEDDVVLPNNHDDESDEISDEISRHHKTSCC